MRSLYWKLDIVEIEKGCHMCINFFFETQNILHLKKLISLIQSCIYYPYVSSFDQCLYSVFLIALRRPRPSLTATTQGMTTSTSMNKLQ